MSTILAEADPSRNAFQRFLDRIGNPSVLFRGDGVELGHLVSALLSLTLTLPKSVEVE